MDGLSSLVRQANLLASLDVRCQLAGGFHLPHDDEAAGTVPFHLVLSGECQVQTAAEIFPVRGGDFVLLPRGSAHAVHNDPRRLPVLPVSCRADGWLPLCQSGDGALVEVDLLCGRFCFSSGIGDWLLSGLPEPWRISFSSLSAQAMLESLVGWIRQEAGQSASGSVAIVTSLVQALLTLALREQGNQPDTPPGLLKLLGHSRLAISVHAVLKAPEYPWTIAELGRLAAMSRATYARHFAESAGMGVGAFLLRLRMLKACALLRQTSQRAGEIGLAVGYQSEAAFGKAFRQFSGLAPGRYRQQYMQHPSMP